MNQALRHLLLAFSWLLLAVAGCSQDAADSGAVVESFYTLSPPEGGIGQALTVTFEAADSAFEYEDTDVDFGPGISVDDVSVDDGWTMRAQITIEPDAETGKRDVSLFIDGRETLLDDAFRVRSDSLIVSPDAGKMGETLEVQLIGNNTQWLQGRTWVSFGDEIEIIEFEVLSETIAEAKIAIDPDATPGWRDVYTEDLGHVVTRYDGFLVDRVALAATFDPEEAAQGDTVEFTIIGRDTDFDGSTDLAFYSNGLENPDIVIDSLTVLDAENMWGRMSLSNAAQLGPRDVHITTGTEGLVIEDAFDVIGGDLSLDEVAISLSFNVSRGLDNSSGVIRESVNASAIFYIPLDPPCPDSAEAAACSDGLDNDNDGYVDCFDSDCEQDLACAASGPQPYDSNISTASNPTGGDPHDCPDPTTVSAGDRVYFESPANTVTLDKVVDAGSGFIYYVGTDLTMDDYQTDQDYDLHLEGDPEGLAEEIIEKVQPTVPSDWELTSPTLWNNYTHDRNEDFTFTWTPAQTYPDAFFIAGVGGAWVEDTSYGASVSAIPWDDGIHTFQPQSDPDTPLLLNLAASDASFYAYSYIEGPYFGLKDSIYQYNQTDSYIYLGATLILE